MDQKSTDQEVQEAIQYYQNQMLPARVQKIDQAVEQRTRHFTMVLEDLYDPHNISAVIRTCEVFGFQDVHVIEEVHPYIVSKGILRGSVKWLDVFKYPKRQKCLETLRAKGYQIGVASTHAKMSLEDCNLNVPTAFYLGSELKGNHPQTLERADFSFKLPQYGLTESMNVSVSAGVLISRLRSWIEKEGQGKYALTTREKNLLKAKFYQRSVRGFRPGEAIHEISPDS